MMSPSPQAPWGVTPQPGFAESAPQPLRPLTTLPRGSFPGRYGTVIALVAIIITLASVALATLAPLLVNHSTGVVPADWSRVYDGGLSEDGTFEHRSGCSFSSAGLDVDGDLASQGCKLSRSVTDDLTSKGFYLEATVAAPASLVSAEEPIIVVGTGNSALLFEFSQEGAYIVCTNPCDLQRGLGIMTIGVSAAWHANGFTPNTIAVRYDLSSEHVTLYINSQEVLTITHQFPLASQIVLAAAPSGEALYTHLTLYSASASG